MDGGAGVFACGDHGRLGFSLCGNVPRVRHMQKWDSPDPPRLLQWDTASLPNNTLARARDDLRTPFFDESSVRDERNQVDDVPMEVTLTAFEHYYPTQRAEVQRSTSFNILSEIFGNPISQPHPLISTASTPYGPLGVLNVLPDHMHEGEIEPPPEAAGNPLIDEDFSKGIYWDLIAFGWSRNDAQAPGFPYLSEQKLFPIIGAYNGQLVGEGRIVVDSSFHHWIDINMIGGQAYPRRRYQTTQMVRQGFWTPRGIKYFEKIQAYHRNVIIWLVPRKKQGVMALQALLYAYYEISELQEMVNTKVNIFHLGRETIRLLGTFVGETHVRTWWTYIYLLNQQQHNVDIDLSNLIENTPRAFCFILDEFLTGGILHKFCYWFENYDKNPTLLEALELADQGFRFGLREFKRLMNQVKQEGDTSQNLLST
jgi:hypothetical protein